MSAKLASPYNGPGLVEMILRKDELNLYEFIQSGKSDCIIFGANAQDPALGLKYSDILNAYRIKDVNPEGTLMYMVPKNIDSLITK